MLPCVAVVVVVVVVVAVVVAAAAAVVVVEGVGPAAVVVVVVVVVTQGGHVLKQGQQAAWSNILTKNILCIKSKFDNLIYTVQTHFTKNSKQIILEMKLRKTNPCTCIFRNTKIEFRLQCRLSFRFYRLQLQNTINIKMRSYKKVLAYVYCSAAYNVFVIYS